MTEIEQLGSRKRWTVTYDREAQTVIVEGVQLSDRWQPSETAVLFELPTTYPDQPPRVYIDESVRFIGNGGSDSRRPDFVAPRSSRGEAKWCPMYLDADWGPNQWLGSVLVHIERVM